MPLVLGFAGLLGMVLLLTSAITDASFPEILSGKATDLYRQHEAAHQSAGAASSPASTAPAGGTPPASVPTAGTLTPNAKWNPLNKPIAAWIVPILNWASQHGWNGTVTSGQRTEAEQLLAAEHYGLSHYPSGALASNHVHGGAVDVTDPAGLARVLAGYHGPRKLIWGGPVMGDQPHFSANGH